MTPGLPGYTGKPAARRLAAPVPAALAMLAAGCVSLPTGEEIVQAPAPHLAEDAPPGMIDGRARFRKYFCASLAERNDGGSRDCAAWLHRLPDEPAAAAVPPGAESMPLDVYIVRGAFAECFGEHARPFDAAIAELGGGPHRFETIPVDGRSGTTHNAAQIADFLDARPDDPARPLVLVGYSKGTPDILEFLVGYPGRAARVDAVVSIAGAVGGSRIADAYGGLYDLLFSHLPSSRCESGDGEVVDSLRTDVRRAWIEENALPAHIRYYSVTAFTTRDRLARVLVRPWKRLLRESRRNDGQLLPRDTMIPGSTMLGYLDTDHWSVAMEIEKDLEFFAARQDPTPFPRTALIDAVLRQVANDLATDPNRQVDEQRRMRP